MKGCGVSAIMLFVVGWGLVFCTFGAKDFKMEYDNHITYLTNIQGKKITQDERTSEVNTINYLNMIIKKAKTFENDFWAGPFTYQGISDLPLISWNTVPEATVNSTDQISGKLEFTH